MSTRAGLAIVIVLMLALAGGMLLSGCALQPFSATCGMHPMGMTEGGITVVRMYCDPE